MKHFNPFRIYSFPFQIAVVLHPAASEPASGSVKQNDPIFFPDRTSGRYFFFCSSFPSLIRAPEYNEVHTE